MLYLVAYFMLQESASNIPDGRVETDGRCSLRHILQWYYNDPLNTRSLAKQCFARLVTAILQNELVCASE